jgi:hypothetical protein
VSAPRPRCGVMLIWGNARAGDSMVAAGARYEP